MAGLSVLLVVWLCVAALFFGVPATYFLYMRRRSACVWNLKVDSGYVPSAAVLIPVHNEEKIIGFKLENMSKVVYPAGKLEIYVVNDSSVDGTLTQVSSYNESHPASNVKVFDCKEHLGKAGCLNLVLKNISADVVVISDVDCFLPSDILTKALGYLSDPTVGAVTARELLLNPADSWVTAGEQVYDSTIQSVRIGESKLHSTIIFQGGFAAYKREVLSEFNAANDDSGTALDIVQANRRAIMVPEIGFFTLSPTAWSSKVSIKLRRASHLQHLWARCLKLMLSGKLAMPARIAVPEILLHIFNPLLLVVLSVLTVAVMVEFPFLALALVLLVCAVLLVKRSRVSAVELAQNNLILLLALTSFVSDRTFKSWKPSEDSRSGLTEQMLRDRQLI